VNIAENNLDVNDRECGKDLLACRRPDERTNTTDREEIHRRANN
jgi:hypothetical protein